MLRRRKKDDAEPTASEWAKRGSRLLHDDRDAAEQCYLRAIAIDPRHGNALFDLGLVAKWRSDWRASLDWNLRALEAAPPKPGDDPDPAYWNAGIAATALGDWATARWAWIGFGVTIPDGEGPIDGSFGMAALRLPDGEVVWGRRVDPARIRVLSIPLPDSGFRHGDVCLNDGDVHGTRISNGDEYPVLATLARLEPSSNPTVQIDLSHARPEEVASLIDQFEQLDIPAENWTASIEVLCLACSYGTVDHDSPHHHHHHDHDHADDGTARLGASGDPGTIAAVVDAWAAQCGATVDHVVEVA